MNTKLKKERGITLVALIITIIVLIILAAVTINSLTHEGLADMAIKGTQDYDKAQSDEMNMLSDIDTMVKETLKNIENGTVSPSNPINLPTVTLTYKAKTGNTVTVTTSMISTSDISGITKYIFEYKKSAEDTWNTAVERTTRPEEYKYTGLETNTSYDFRVRTTDNSGNTGMGESISQTTESINDPMNPEDTTLTGKTIDYVPESGIYRANDYYTGISGSSTATTYQEFTTEDLGWTIWGEDDNNLYLISTTVTSNLTLKGENGFNNAVYYLHRICSNCYSNSAYTGQVTRNIKGEDLWRVDLSYEQGKACDWFKTTSNGNLDYGTAWCPIGLPRLRGLLL